MAIGGLVRRIARPEAESPDNARIQAIMDCVKRVEDVLREVDSFVKLPAPDRKLQRIDRLVREAMEDCQAQWQQNAIIPSLLVRTPQVMIALDAELFRRALSMLFRDILQNISQGSECNISIRDAGGEIEICFGEIEENRRLCEPSAPELQDQPWSLGLYLNMAAKIISDQGGKLLVDPEGHAAFPVLVRMPRMVEP